MKKPLKIVLGIFLALVVVIAGAAFVVGVLADGALKVAIETAGTKALNVGVSVGDVDLSISRASLDVRNLTIANPPGYQHKRLLALSDANITVDAGTLLEKVIEVKDIRLDGVNVVLEQRGVSSNNLQDVMKALPSEGKQTSEAEGRKLHIKNLEITNAQASVKLLPVPGRVDTLTLKLAPIRMTDLGGQEGLDSIALSRTILLAIVAGIAEQGAGVLPKEMLGSLVSELERVGTLPGFLLKQSLKILGAGEDAAGAGVGVTQKVIKGAEEVGKGITEGLKSLVKPKDKQE